MNYFFYKYKKYQSLKLKFRIAWERGSNGTIDGIEVLNHIILLLHRTTSYSVREIIQKFCIENSDLGGISPSKIISYLNDNNKLLYRRGL